MSLWLLIGTAIVFALPLAGAILSGISPLLVLPPLLAAAGVLFIAAMSVDYFGVARKREHWGGFGTNPKRAWKRANKLHLRFTAQREVGSPNTPWTARALLISLAECDRLDESSDLIDFLSADAVFSRITNDVTADALRAVALAELGRHQESRELCEELVKCPNRKCQPVVAYAKASIFFRRRRYQEVIEEVEKVVDRKSLPKPARRDLQMLQARALVSLSRSHDATVVLAKLVSEGWRREVEHMGNRAFHKGDSMLASAVRSAMGMANPYR
jgi:hypothetical protein